MHTCNEKQKEMLGKFVAAHVSLGRGLHEVIHSIHQHPLGTIIFQGMPSCHEVNSLLAMQTFEMTQSIRSTFGVPLVDIYNIMGKFLEETGVECGKPPADMFADLAKSDEEFFAAGRDAKA